MSQECPVCYESIQPDEVRVLDCSHIVCTQCSFKIHPPRCPMCRTGFVNPRSDVSSPGPEETLHQMHVSTPIQIPSYDSDGYNDIDDFFVAPVDRAPRRRRRRQRTVVGSAPSVLSSAAPLPISPSEAETILAELMGTRAPSEERCENHSTSDRSKQIRRNNRNRWRTDNMNHRMDE